MPRLTFRPVTSENWKDLTALFGPRGACAGCWCMWWRLPRARFRAGAGQGNRRALKRLVDAGAVPGILAYEAGRPVEHGSASCAPQRGIPREGAPSRQPHEVRRERWGRPVGWCSVAPREQFPGLERSRVLARVDDQPVWSIACFFVARDRRRTGITAGLIREAVRYARSSGGRIVEAYPVEPAAKGMADAFAYTGIASAFRKAGFTEAARRSPRRAVYRRSVGAPRAVTVARPAAQPNTPHFPSARR